MKIKLLSCLLFLFLAAKTFAQCNPAVPSNAVVVNATQTINGGFDPIWVCSGDTLHSDGGFHNTFLEAGSVMTTSGGIDSIFVKSGAKFFMNGGIHVIYYEDINDLFISGGIPTLGSCAGLEFNYINAPANGCALVLSAAFSSSDTSICKGDCIGFNSFSSNATSWQWLFSGAIPESSSDQNPASVCYNETGSFDVTLIVSNSNESDTLSLENFIVVNPTPVIPTLTQVMDTIFATGNYASYQWYFEGALINGATDYFYVAAQNGTYSVVVTSNETCGEASAEINFIFTGISQPSADIAAFTVFPNPATDRLNIRFITYESENNTLSLTDCRGRLLKTWRLNGNSGDHTISLDISGIATGLYILAYENGGSSIHKKLVIEK